MEDERAPQTEEQAGDPIEEAPPSRRRPQPPPPALPPVAVAGAVLAAVAGAGVWAFVHAQFEAEVGYVALAVGLLAGLAASRLGARGGPAALVTGGIALAGVIGGMVLGTWWERESVIDEFIQIDLSDVAYASYMGDVDLWAEAEAGAWDDDRAVRLFMLDRGYGSAEILEPEQIDDATLAGFRETWPPRFERWAGAKPDYPEWRAEIGPVFRRAMREQVPLPKSAFDDLDVLSVVFFALAVWAAHAQVARAGGRS